MAQQDLVIRKRAGMLLVAIVALALLGGTLALSTGVLGGGDAGTAAINPAGDATPTAPSDLESPPALSGSYIREQMTRDGLRTMALIPLERQGSEAWMVFVDGPDEKGCIVVWGSDGNMGFSRLGTRRTQTALAPEHPALVFTTLNGNNEYVCITIQDAALNAAVASIELRLGNQTFKTEVAPSTTHYLLTPAMDVTSGLIRFYDRDGKLLYEQQGQTY